MESPASFGRGIVVRGDTSVSGQATTWPVITIDEDALTPGAPLDGLIDALHRAWVSRRPHVVRWAVPDDRLSEREVTDLPPWELGPRFLFPLERLRFLAFSNNVDSRSGTATWWWAAKAGAVGATPGGPADVVLPDGTAAWVDGGPPASVPQLELPVIAGEDVERGSLRIRSAPSRIDQGPLASDQQAAVTHGAGAARIVAPAGSGKTRVLVARIDHLVSALGYDPDTIGAFAYNTRAASEMRERLTHVPRSVRTIHALGWEIVRRHRPGVTLISESDQRSLLERLVKVPRRVDTDPMAAYLEALDRTRLALIAPAVVEAERDDVPGFADLFDEYRRLLVEHGLADHGEQVYGAIEALCADSDLRRDYQREYRHLLVDEFQDLTPAFLLLIRMIASPELDVFGVGDDDQVIYGYSGADPAFLLQYPDLFPGADSHALEVNYRCPPSVVGATSRLLAHNQRRIDKTIRPAPNAPDGSLQVQPVDGDTMAVELVELVEGLLAKGADPAHIAVLSRVNSTLMPAKLGLGGSGVPTNDLLDGSSIDRTSVRALASWMRLGIDPDRMSRQDLISAARRPGRGLSRLASELFDRSRYDLATVSTMGHHLDARQSTRWSAFVADLKYVGRAARTGRAIDLVDVIIDEVGLGASAATLDSARSNAARSGHSDDLVAIRRATALHPTLDGFWEWMRTTLSSPADAAGVMLSTVHRVKGMEWPHVIVFGADAGAMPHTLSDDIEEERRVFHVAITRGSESVTVLADRRRPSRFLNDMRTKPSATKQPPATPSKDVIDVGSLVTITGGYEGTVERVDDNSVGVRLEGGALLTTSPAEILRVTPPQREPEPEVTGLLVDALRAWRLETSRRLGVPAFVVFNDATMNEIASRVPQTERDLLEVTGIGPSKLEAYGDDILSIVASVNDS